MPRDNRCMYMAHVCFICCSDCVGVCENICCVAAVVKDSAVLSLGLLKYVVTERQVAIHSGVNNLQDDGDEDVHDD